MPMLNITIPDADETTKGIAEIATQTEVDAGTDDERIVTPLKLTNFSGLGGTDHIEIPYFNTNNIALVDTTTYYIGQMTTPNTGVTSFAHIPIPSGTVKEIHVNTWTTNTVGAEEATLNFVTNNGVDSYEVATDFTANSRNELRTFTGLSVAITGGNSYFEFITPNYATNPANFQIRIIVKLEL